MCREFMRDKMAGLLRVTIRHARSLPAADPWPGTSDPYAIVCVGDSCHVSKTVLNNLNPSWEESCTLFVRWGRHAFTRMRSRAWRACVRMCVGGRAGRHRTRQARCMPGTATLCLPRLPARRWPILPVTW